MNDCFEMYQQTISRKQAYSLRKHLSSNIIRFILASAWILSRVPKLSEEIYQTAILKLNAVPNANVAFLEAVDQSMEQCDFYWTANIEAVNTVETDSK